MLKNCVPKNIFKMWWLLSLVTVVSASNAGIHLSYGEDLLFELQDNWLPQIFKELEGLKLPDLSFSGNIIFEDYTFNFTSIVLETIGANTKDALISLDESSQSILINLKNQNLTFSGDYSS